MTPMLITGVEIALGIAWIAVAIGGFHPGVN